MKNVIELEPEFLVFLLEGSRAFVNPKELLEDISAEDAVREVSGVNHTIARIIAHLQYWQTWFYEGATATLLPYPEKNDHSFPQVNAEEWEEVRSDFLATLDKIKGLCSDSALLERSFSQGTNIAGGHSERSVALTLLYTVALHNAHHYGQIITLRQMMGKWPPQAGSMTW